ncbi:tRNA-splicing endonuclease subunit sen54 [Onygenales sp. PD_12]|nr:tRNA-splicing endonuclease subunit sen54 [Onygenales sp. PD_12]
MADADEDTIFHPPSTSPSASASQDQSTHIDNDISDETQDFRFLNSLSFLPDPNQPASLPRRGEKDFEPNPTLRQADVLAASRDAMHNALAYPRLHNPKNRVVGIYCPTGMLRPAGWKNEKPDAAQEQTIASEETGEVGSKTTTKKKKNKKPPPPHGIGRDTCVCVPSPRGQHFRTVGQADHWNRMWLLPEEALYLLERGSLDIRWPAPGGDDEDEEDVDQGVPMSLQAAYACFIGRGGLTVERYTVYAGLRRGGYAVVRAGSWGVGEEEEQVDTDADADADTAAQQIMTTGSRNVGVFGFLARIFNSLHTATGPKGDTVHGPVIGLGIHRSYQDIYRALTLIPTPTPSLPRTTKPKTTPPYRIAYNIYKPSTPLRKSAPGAPDFLLAIISSRTHPHLPTLSELTALLNSTPLDPPRGEKMDRMMYMRLRHGWRNVILAVVDQGVVSFLRVGEAGFGGERLYENFGKGGGGGGGNKGGFRRGAAGGGGKKGAVGGGGGGGK